MIPLNLLTIAPENVRKTAVGADDTLVALIRAKGLLQNLVVRPNVAPKGKKNGQPVGTYAVVAGGRRLQGLQLLAEEGHHPPDLLVPCNVILEDGIGVSLAENVGRKAMEPLDEFDAFAAMLNDGKGEDEIARQFGVTVVHVRQRMKLARVSPVIRAAFQADEINLDTLKAYTLTDDFARQEEVFQAGWQGSDPYHVRRMLLGQKLSATSKVVKFVGLDAYEAAGGIITRDLFGESPDCIEDPALIERMAREKLKAHADALIAEGWAWIEPVDAITWDLRRTCAELKANRPQLSEEEHAEAEELTAELDELDEDDDGERVAEIHARLSELDQKVAATTWSAEQKAAGGGWVAIGHDGILTIELGWVRREAGSGEGGESAPGHSNAAAREPERADPPVPGHSWALVEDMSAHLTAALQAELVERPDLAYLLLLHSLVLDIFYHSTDRSLNIRSHMQRAEWHGATVKGSPAAEYITGRQSHFKSLRLPQKANDLWVYLEKATDEGRAELLAVCVASTVFAVQKTADRGNALRVAREGLARARMMAFHLRLDMTKWWRPTVANYFGHVSKDIVIDALTQAGQVKPGEKLASAKKAELAALAEERMGPTTWLPTFLRFLRAEPKQVSAEAANDAGDEQALAAE
jgi:ParB family chromosome partitioning protein